MNGVQTRFKCKLDVKRCKRFVFPPSSLLPRSNALKTKAIRYFQTDRTLTRIVSPPLLYCHATHILSFLPNTEISHRPNADRDYLFQKLGDEFTRTQLLEEAVAMGIKENTALTWLKRLTKHGKLISMDGKGLYTRACVYE